MASPASTRSLSRKRILANSQERKRENPLEAQPEIGAEDAARRDATSILSKPVKIGQRKKKKKTRAKTQSTTRVVLLGIIGVTGIAAIIGLRYLAEFFGVNWLGD